MKKITTTGLRVALIIIGCTFITACSTAIDGKNYASVDPVFDIESFFDGQVKAWGIVQNRSGEVVQRFIVNIKGNLEGDVLTLDETFVYGVGDGPLTRLWEIKKTGENQFLGRAGDIAGPAEGVAYGNAFNFNYEMDLPVDDSEYRVVFDDWFWAFDDTTMMNRSYIKKFGIVMAEVTIFMQKQ